MQGTGSNRDKEARLEPVPPGRGRCFRPVFILEIEYIRPASAWDGLS